MKKVLAFVITHGELACSLAQVSEKLTVPPIPLQCYSNKTRTSEDIVFEIQKRIEDEKPEKTIIFVDLIGGSCWIMGNRIKRDNPDISVIAGVNVPMLISFYINFSRMNWSDLLQKIVEDAKKGIVIR